MSAGRGLLLLACCAAAAALAQEDVVDWHDAAQCVGRQCGVRGTVAATENAGPTIRLFFDVADHSVRIILMRGWLVDWPPYVGRTIIANGKVQRFRDHIEMIVLTPDDIAVIGGEPPPATATETVVSSPTAAATFTAPPTEALPTEAPPTAPPTLIPTTVVVPPTAPPTVAPPTGAPPSPSPPAVVAPTPGTEVEQLRRRVHELEQRIEQLEGR